MQGNTGGVYDPTANTWTATTTTSAPTARKAHSAIWTGSTMIVWGGNTGTVANTGGVYNLAGNSWTATNTTGAPVARQLHTAIWTSGSKMIVWGGNNGSTTYYDSGGIYDPTGNSWTATPTTSAPSVRSSHSGIWTGSKMFIFGGYDGSTYLSKWWALHSVI